MAITLLEASFTSAALVAPALALGLQAPSEPPVPAAETVTIAEQVLDFPLPGEFLAGGRPAAAPTTREDVAAFRITKHQVSLADYQRCVAAGACAAADARRRLREMATGRRRGTTPRLPASRRRFP